MVTKKSSCEDAPQCNGPQIIPAFSLKELKRAEMPADPCNASSFLNGGVVGGGFQPIGGLSAIEDFNVTPCFNSETNIWQFSIPSVTIKVFLDICDENITAGGLELINSIDEIPVNDYCNAMQDFKQHYNYPIGGLPPVTVQMTYIIRPVLIKHEEIHKQQYIKLLEELRPDFEADYLSYKPVCEEGKSIEDVTKAAKAMIKKKINDYLIKVNQLRNEEIDASEKSLVKELLTQNSGEYREYLRSFIDDLSKRAPYCGSL